jgi:hypothetical protein
LRNINGLSKGSPINLSLTRGNYEALIDRHGQYIRWMMADKCPCSLRSGRPDYNCPYCGGDGIRYSFQRTKIVTAERATMAMTDTVQLLCPPGSCVSVRRITNGKKDFTPGEIMNGNMVRIVGETPARWDAIEVTYEMTDEVEVTAPATYLGKNLFRVGVPDADTVHGGVSPDIVAVLRFENVTTGQVFADVTPSRGMIRVNGDPLTVEPADVFRAQVRYIPPRKFLLVGQAANLVEQQWLDHVGGDASLSFPNEYRVSEGDVVTALVGMTYSKAIMTRSGEEIDRIPEWYIHSITKIETLGREYVQGVDFILYDRNRIWWIGDGPAAGENYYIMFAYHQTYKVLKDFPNTRSSENQLLPRRVALKLMNMSGQASEGI